MRQHRFILRVALPISLLAAVFGCAAAAAAPTVLRLETVATGLASPLYLTAPAGDKRLFVVEQPGRVRIVKDGMLLPTPFLDISGLVRYGGERGLLGLAFHPGYASNGWFYVNYTDASGTTQVRRFTVGANPDVADASSGKTILSVAQPFANHNGGMVLFGPDGMLYVGMGDGGSGGDPRGNGQNKNALLGKLLRLDVDHGDPYAVPSSNPFVGQAGMRGEIWALGLRNPWRFAFDAPTGRLYIADVGQNAWEEVNVAAASAAGLNYGWKIMEGSRCYPSGSCSANGLTLPALEYSHSDGCSVTGGFVYRGKAIPEIDGHYFYADYCTGWIRSFRWEAGAVTEKREWAMGSAGQVLSFGQDAAGELYVLSSNGKVYRISRG